MYKIGISIALFISSVHLAPEVFHFMFKSFFKSFSQSCIWGDPGLMGLGSSTRLMSPYLDTFCKPSHGLQLYLAVSATFTLIYQFLD